MAAQRSFPFPCLSTIPGDHAPPVCPARTCEEEVVSGDSAVLSCDLGSQIPERRGLSVQPVAWESAAHGQGLWQIHARGSTEGRRQRGPGAWGGAALWAGCSALQRADGIAEGRVADNRESLSHEAPDQPQREDRPRAAERSPVSLFPQGRQKPRKEKGLRQESDPLTGQGPSAGPLWLKTRHGRSCLSPSDCRWRYVCW